MKKIIIATTASTFIVAGWGINSILDMVSLIDNLKGQLTTTRTHLNKTKKNLNKANEKISNAKSTVSDRRDKLTGKTGTKIGKKSAAALIPFAGAAIVAGLSVEEYCESLKDNIDLSNILNDTNEHFDYDKCYEIAKNDTSSIFGAIADNTSEVLDDAINTVNSINPFSSGEEYKGVSVN